MADRLHLSPRHRAEIAALLRKHLPDVEVWAYGSRVTGRSHDGSDLDLVLRAPGLQRIPAVALADMADSIRESAIPFLVEAHDWARLPAHFHPEIEHDHVVLLTNPGRRGLDRTRRKPMAAKKDVIRPLDEGVHHRSGQRPRPQTPRPTANPAGQRPDDGKPTESGAAPKD